MKVTRRRVRWLGAALLAAGVVGVAIAPSWRNYYLRRGAVRIVEDVPYVPGRVDSKHRLDLYLPRAGARPWPVVVFVHGGFWRPFDRRMLQPFTGLHGCVGVALANHGVATAVLSYRQLPEAASLGDAIDDVARAVRYLVDNIGDEGGDPTRVYVVGHSAGGLVAALLATEPAYLREAGVGPERVRGFAGLAGPYDLARLMAFPDRSLAAKVRASTTDGDVERYSPERHVRRGGPPTLLLVGGDDTPALLAEQRSMAAALRNVGGDVTAAELPGEGHMDLVMHLSRPNDAALRELLAFIDRHR
jgi:acetyl esterase/lipase